ncbi:MAG: hypothetical protein Q9213_005444 [Squamulea squamosa]
MAVLQSPLVLSTLLATSLSAPAEPPPGEIPHGRIQVRGNSPEPTPMVGYLLPGNDPNDPSKRKPFAVPSWNSLATPTLTATVTIFNKLETVTIGPTDTRATLMTTTKNGGATIECVQTTYVAKGTGCVDGWERTIQPTDVPLPVPQSCTGRNCRRGLSDLLGGGDDDDDDDDDDVDKVIFPPKASFYNASDQRRLRIIQANGENNPEQCEPRTAKPLPEYQVDPNVQPQEGQ